MNWTRYKLLIISGGITLVISAGLIFWILSTRAENQEISTEMQSLSRRQSQLFSEKPYPSQKNFDQLIAEQAEIQDQRDQLKSLIREGQLKPIRIDRARFGDYIKGPWINSLHTAAENATKGGEHGVILDDKYFSMSRFIEDDDLPEIPEIPDLMLELKTISYLSELLFNQGISELVVVKRVEKNKEPSKTTNRFPQLGGFPGIRPGNEQPVEAEGISELEKQKERLFKHSDYRMEFKIYEDFFWGLVNEIVSDENQFVITEVYVTNSNDDLWPDYLKPVVAQRSKSATRGSRNNRPGRREPVNELERLLMADVASTPETPAAPKEEVKIAGLAERRQNVTGGDLLNVVLVVRVYRLNNETAENEQGI